jgi:hypothetical protein
MSILSALKTSGAWPVNELNLMTSGSPGVLVHEKANISAKANGWASR